MFQSGQFFLLVALYLSQKPGIQYWLPAGCKFAGADKSKRLPVVKSQFSIPTAE